MKYWFLVLVVFLVLPFSFLRADITTGLVGYWKFDGDTQDSIGSNNGTASGGPIYNTGKLGQALSFDGVDDRVNMGNVSAYNFSDTQSFSYSLWTKGPSVATRLVFGKKASGGSGNGWSVELHSSDSVRTYLSNGTVQSGVSKMATGINDGNWHLVTVVVDRSTNLMNTYLDGAVIGSATDISAITGTIGASNSVIVGANGALTEFHKGNIDDIRIYNRALSAFDIAELFNSSDIVSPPPSPTPVPPPPPPSPSPTGTPGSETIPGNVILYSTFHSISVKAPFTGDNNSNNSASIQYRVLGSGTWLNAFAPIVDRRASVNSQSNIDNQYQARGSIVGLIANTVYEIQVTWSDPDGVGSQPSVSTVSTLSYTPPTGGNTFYVSPTNGSNTNDGSSGSPWATIPYAISNTSPGDTIRLKTGSYPPLIISVSGTADAYRTLMPDTDAQVTITGDNSSATAKTLTISANYWRITGGIKIGPSGGTSVSISNGANHLYLEDLTGVDVAIGNHPTNGTDQGYYGALEMKGINDHIYLLRNNFHTNTVTSSNGPYIDGVIFGILSHSVICNNTFIGQSGGTGGFWDGIGNGTNNSLTNTNNVDICNNILTEYRDDSTELDGGGINLRYWGNIMRTTASTGNSGIILSVAPIWVGPTYVFRNISYPSAPSSYGLKYYSGDPGQTTLFVFHNTFDTSGASGGGHETISGARRTIFRNNIFNAAGNATYGSVTTVDMNYDLLFSTIGASVVGNWGGTTNYSTLANFQTGTGQELQGVSANPLLNSARQISAFSPAFDAGQILANFNSIDSAWPYTNNAPDIGAYEVGGVSPTPSPPSPTPTPLPGDLNSDHIVNSLDFSIMNSNWYTSNATADLNSDGSVNSLDYAILSSNWGKTW